MLTLIIQEHKNVLRILMKHIEFFQIVPQKENMTELGAIQLERKRTCKKTKKQKAL